MTKKDSLLLKKFVPNYQKTEEAGVRAKYCYLEGWVSILANIILFIFKFVFGLLINSISLIADSFHTLGDVLTSGVVIVGAKISHRPPDSEHPYGHGRFEAVATLIITILLIIVGVNFFKDSIERLIHIQPVKGSWLVIGALFFSAMVKEWLARFSINLGRQINSSTLIADGWHHRTDSIASALITIAILAATLGYPWVDSIFGLLVSSLIIYTGFEIGRPAVNFLLGQAPEETLVKQIESAAQLVEGVVGTHKTIIHDYGSRKIASLHVQVANHLSVEESHHIATAVKKRISQECANVSVEVHIEPSKKQAAPKQPPRENSKSDQ